MNRPSSLNAISTPAQWEMHSTWRWLDAEPTLSLAIITGTGRAFSSGADLKEWHSSMTSAADADADADADAPPMGRKPVVAAVNGLALGAGCEFAVNCDLVVASAEAVFGLPEVKRGVAPIGGALPRLIRTLGLQRASEVALLGEPISAAKALEWGLVNRVVDKGRVVEEAVRMAARIAENSPDAIVCTRAGLRMGWEEARVEGAVERVLDNEWEELQKGENINIGLEAFAKKEKPVWVGSRL